MENLLDKNVKVLLEILWKEDPELQKILAGSASTAEARNQVFSYLSDLERQYFNIYNDRQLTKLHIFERNNAKECIRVFKNVIRTENEQNTGFAALKMLRKAAMGLPDENLIPSAGFVMEFIHLVKGINGKSGVIEEVVSYPEDHLLASQLRSRKLNNYARKLETSIQLIPKGTDPLLMKEQARVKRKILDYFHASEEDWAHYHWHMRHIITDRKMLEELVGLGTDEKEGLRVAEEKNIPFQITPYYLSLFNAGGPAITDQAIRAQVLPDKEYSERVSQNRLMNVDMDFMGEKSTSPIPGITRRYPQIVILKPIDTCPQICVYCQRNWEIKSIAESGISDRIIDNAINWIRDNSHITEVLITGGDPLMLPDLYLKKILRKLSTIRRGSRLRSRSGLLRNS